jgi:hypothetical protein
MKQSDLFRENANGCLQLDGKAPDHGFVRIPQAPRPSENGAANVWEEDAPWGTVKRQSGQDSSFSLRELVTN